MDKGQMKVAEIISEKFNKLEALESRVEGIGKTMAAMWQDYMEMRALHMTLFSPEILEAAKAKAVKDMQKIGDEVKKLKEEQAAGNVLSATDMASKFVTPLK